MSDHYVSIKTSTWNRESHGLYDYESDNIIKNKFKLTSDSYLIQNNDKIEVIPRASSYSSTSETKFLLCFVKGQNSFTLESNKSEFKGKGMHYENSWLVIKKVKGSLGYLLSEGDTIRLGKAQLKVKEIKGPRKNRTSKALTLSKHIYQGGLGGCIKETIQTDDPHIVNTFDSEDEGNQCRICLMEENTEENPLIKPCKCSGSMGLIHIECLQKWFSTKVATREQNNSTCYSWKSPKCELCKFDYPEKLSIRDEVFELLLMKKPENNFITLESATSQNNESKCINVISFQDKKNIRLGRGHDSDIRLGDISVSRNHANIHLTETGLYLADVSSKFGTLIRIKRPVSLTLGFKFLVQCGRTLIEISIKKPFRLFGCFGGCGKKKNSDDENSRTIKDVTEESFSNQI